MTFILFDKKGPAPVVYSGALFMKWIQGMEVGIKMS